MKKIGIKSSSLIQKSLCTALIALLGTSLIVGGLFADPGCATSCCCKTTENGMRHTPEKQLRSEMDCCSEITINPCDLASGQTFELQEYRLAATNSNPSNLTVLSGVLTNTSFDNKIFRIQHRYPSIREKSQDPPLYLQKRSFLI